MAAVESYKTNFFGYLSRLNTEFPIPSFVEVFRLSFGVFPQLVGHYCS